MKNGINDHWLVIGDVPDDVHEGCWLEFEKCFRFEEGQEEDVKRIFWSHIAGNYSNWLNGARKLAMKAGTLVATDAIKPYSPDWILRPLWSQMVDVWKTKEWQLRSLARKPNRAASRLNHTAGSAPFDKHKAALAENLGRQPSLMESWLRIHKRRKGTRAGKFSTPCAKQIAIDYCAKLGVATPDDAESDDDILNVTPECDNLGAWCEATGGKRKNRLVGFGTRKSARDLLGPSPSAPPRTTASTSSSQAPIGEESLEWKIEEVVDRRLAVAGPSTSAATSADFIDPDLD